MKNEANKPFPPSLGWSIVKLSLAVAVGVLILFLGGQACVVLFRADPMYGGIAEVLRVVICIGALSVPLWGVFQMGHTVVTRRRIGRGERQQGKEKADRQIEKARIVISFKKNFLAVLHWGSAIVLLDGKKRFTIPWWRDVVLDIEPGKHHIEIAINYLLIMRGICKAELGFEVVPGDIFRLEYQHPLIIFWRGTINIVRLH